MNHNAEEWDFTETPPLLCSQGPHLEPQLSRTILESNPKSLCLLSSLISVLKSMIPTFNNKYLKYLFKNPEMETILPTHKAQKKKPQRKK